MSKYLQGVKNTKNIIARLQYSRSNFIMSKKDSSYEIPKFYVDDFQVSKNTEFYIKETSNFTRESDDRYFATYWKPKHVEKPKGLVFIW